MREHSPITAPKSLLPTRSAQDGPLFFVIAIIVFLACVSALIARTSFNTAKAWRADLNNAMTVQIKTLHNTQKSAQSAAKLIRALPGIAHVQVYSRRQAKALLAPWLGAGNIPNDLPLPIPITITLEKNSPVDKAAIEKVLRKNHITASVDDHRQWARALGKSAWFLQLFSIGALSLLIAAAIAVTGFATQASLAARRDVVDTLHLVGAFDSFIAAEFERKFASLGLRAGLLGAAMAALVLGVTQIVLMRGTDIMLPVFHLDLIGIGIVMIAPPLTAMASALTARRAVARTLRERQ